MCVSKHLQKWAWPSNFNLPYLKNCLKFWAQIWEIFILAQKKYLEIFSSKSEGVTWPLGVCVTVLCLSLFVYLCRGCITEVGWASYYFCLFLYMHVCVNRGFSVTWQKPSNRYYAAILVHQQIVNRRAFLHSSLVYRFGFMSDGKLGQQKRKDNGNFIFKGTSNC